MERPRVLYGARATESWSPKVEDPCAVETSIGIPTVTPTDVGPELQLHFMFALGSKLLPAVAPWHHFTEPLADGHQPGAGRSWERLFGPLRRAEHAAGGERLTRAGVVPAPSIEGHHLPSTAAPWLSPGMERPRRDQRLSWPPSLPASEAPAAARPGGTEPNSSPSPKLCLRGGTRECPLASIPAPALRRGWSRLSRHAARLEWSVHFRDLTLVKGPLSLIHI